MEKHLTIWKQLGNMQKGKNGTNGKLKHGKMEKWKEWKIENISETAHLFLSTTVTKTVSKWTSSVWLSRLGVALLVLIDAASSLAALSLKKVSISQFK